MSAGRGGTVFDEDPKRWRLIAEGFTTSGRALEIATAVFPQNFVVLAGMLFSLKALWSWQICFLPSKICGPGRLFAVFPVLC